MIKLALFVASYIITTGSFAWVMIPTPSPAAVKANSHKSSLSLTAASSSSSSTTTTTSRTTLTRRTKQTKSVQQASASGNKAGKKWRIHQPTRAEMLPSERSSLLSQSSSSLLPSSHNAHVGVNLVGTTTSTQVNYLTELSRRSFVYHCVVVPTAMATTWSMFNGAQANALPLGELKGMTTPSLQERAQAQVPPSRSSTKSISVNNEKGDGGSGSGTRSEQPPTASAIFDKAYKRAVGGGLSGASAGVIQVLSLMWLRTTMNYQYRNGGSTTEALAVLYKQGGVPRLYQGLPFALLQGPLSRFGDVAASAGTLVLLDSYEGTRHLPLPVKSAAGSVLAGCWRIFLMPIDTLKVTMQVKGKEGLPELFEKFRQKGAGVFYEGALASGAATFVGHYPWYLTYNALAASLPPAPADDVLLKLCRAAVLGICASCVSDTCSNSLRVIKTTKQTSAVPITYPNVVKLILEEDGIRGIFGRGLKTRLLVNSLQGAVFSVAWKYFESVLA